MERVTEEKNASLGDKKGVALRPRLELSVCQSLA